MCESEVALLRQKILEECEAMKHGLTGLSRGSSQHAFIDARMRRIDNYHHQLAHHIGEAGAARTVCELYERVIG